MNNFVEQQPGQRIRETLQHQSKADEPLEVELLELNPCNAAHLIIMANAYLPGDELQFPPKYQQLDTDHFVFLDGQQRSYFLVPYTTKLYEADLQLPKMWAALGKEVVYPIKAVLKCIDNKVILELFGPEKDYLWAIHIQGTLYTGCYKG
jgi:hypothetical protein